MAHSNSWIANIRDCTDLFDATAVMVQALGEKAEAEAAGVFILDYLKQNLLLYASWSKYFGQASLSNASLPMDTRHERDPLCFAIKNGEPFLSDSTPAIPHSLSLFYSHQPGGHRTGVYPLHGQRNRVIGAIVFAFSPEVGRYPQNFIVLHDFCGIYLDGLIRQRDSQSQMAYLSSIAGGRGGKSSFGMRAEYVTAPPVLLGKSPLVRRLKEKVAQYAMLDFPVLITGELGSGHRDVAEAIHFASRRRESRYSVVKCGALSPLALESELFGHVRGAFPGADSEHPGQLRNNEAGTLLLEDIDAVPLDTQGKINNLLQSGELKPVGSTKPLYVKTRLIATSTKDLNTCVSDGLFRQDLLVRLSQFSIELPPLRMRMEDLPQILPAMLANLPSPAHDTPLTLGEDAVWALMKHSYPGNIMELSVLFAKAAALAALSGQTELGAAAFFSPPADSYPAAAALPLLVKAFEELIIRQKLEIHNQSIPKAAKALGIPRTTLQSKLKSF